MSKLQLIVNPGSTTTKLAVFRDEEKICQETVEHTPEELAQFANLIDQVPFRKGIAKDFLKKNNIDPSELSAIMGRGGMVWGIESGGYKVNDDLVTALKDENLTSPHASCLGGLIGKSLADELGINAYIYDAVTGAALPEIARITGYKEIRRNSCCHVLNMRAMSMKYAEENGLDYNKLNLVVVHMGGGISLSVHRHGKIIDSIGDDDGPFSPERAGTTQILEVLKLCFNGQNTYEDMKKKCRGKGGLYAHLGTSDGRKVEKMIADGDEYAKLVYDAMAYQVAKGIGELSIALKGEADAIVLTGGLAYSKMFTDNIAQYVKFIAPVVVEPGENEMEALAMGGLRILNGQETAKEFKL